MSRSSKTPNGVKVACFFCKTSQVAPEPPCLHTCIKCGKNFRVLRDRSWVAPKKNQEDSYYGPEYSSQI